MRSTKAEIEYIKKIGTFATESVRVRTSMRKHLLKGYLAGCRLRKRWENMDRDTVMAFARHELNRELAA